MFNKLFSLKQLVQILFTSSLIIILIGFVATGVFLYSNFYKLITQTEELIIIQQLAILEPVKINLLNEVLKNKESKTKGGSVVAPELRSPF